jgi:protein involved in polysaccharide export with SLBB domain
MNSFIVKPGDEIKVERSNGIVENKVTISGPVHKPGNYSANSGITVSGLIKLAGGIVKETANYSHGQIIRKTSGGKDEIISFDLRKALEGDPQEDKALKPLDEIKLFEEKEITNEVLKVYVGGAVRTTGVFDFHDGMKLSDLVLLANGLKNDASGDAEIARKTEGDTSVIIKANIKKALEDKNSPDNVTLQALDKVNIIAKGDYLFEPEVVVLKGQVKKPGAYALTHRGERLSSLIKRAGGLTDRAFPEGTVFMRNISNISSSSQVETAVSVQDDLFRKANLDLRAELIKAGAKDVDMKTLSNDIRGDGVTKQMMDKAGVVSENSETTNTVTEKDSDVFSKALESQNDENAIVKTRIAIPMIKILSERVSENDDIELMDGDEITVPVIPHTVSVLGAVMNPTTIMFNKNGNASYYIDRAGGYSRNSDHRRTVVVRANGEVMRLRNVRKIGRGDIILVPPKAGIVRKDIYKEVGTIAQILGNLAVTYKVVRDDD